MVMWWPLVRWPFSGSVAISSILASCDAVSALHISLKELVCKPSYDFIPVCAFSVASFVFHSLHVQLYSALGSARAVAMLAEGNCKVKCNSTWMAFFLKLNTFTVIWGVLSNTKLSNLWSINQSGASLSILCNQLSWFLPCAGSNVVWVLSFMFKSLWETLGKEECVTQWSWLEVLSHVSPHARFILCACYSQHILMITHTLVLLYTLKSAILTWWVSKETIFGASCPHRLQ